MNSTAAAAAAAMSDSAHPPPPPHLHPLPPPTPPPLLPLPPFPPHLFAAAPQPQRRPSPKPPAGAAKPPAKRKTELFGLAKGAQPCTECGKRFSSWKALFGHMRCHPERQWRGINPPTQSQRPHFTDEEHEIAATLILLSNGPPLAAGDVGGGSINRSPSSSSEGAVLGARKGEGKLIGRHRDRGGVRVRNHPYYSPSPSSSPSPPTSYSPCPSSPSHRCQNLFLLDLNMPPPLNGCEGESKLALDLKLGI